MSSRTDIICREIKGIYLGLGWDIKFVGNAFEVLEKLDSREPLKGFSMPPFIHSSSQWKTLTKDLTNLNFELHQQKHLFTQGFGELELAIDKVMSDIEQIMYEGRTFHEELRAKSVKYLPETGTEFVSEISIPLVEWVLHSFARNDTKSKRFFIEFLSISGSDFLVELRDQEYPINHITIAIGMNFDWSEKNMDVISQVRELIGLSPELEGWEVPTQPPVVNSDLQRRLLAEGIDEWTLAKRLYPDWVSLWTSYSRWDPNK